MFKTRWVAKFLESIEDCRDCPFAEYIYAQARLICGHPRNIDSSGLEPIPRTIEPDSQGKMGPLPSCPIGKKETYVDTGAYDGYSKTRHA